MICPQCGHAVADGKRFCPECGTKLPEVVTAPKMPVAGEPAAAVEAPVEETPAIEEAPEAGEFFSVTEESEADTAPEAVFESEQEPCPEDVTPEPEETEEPAEAAAGTDAPAETAAPAAVPAPIAPADEKKAHPLVPPATGKYATEKPIGILRWSGIDILFHLPVVRFVMTIVWSFTNVRPSLKNFARARLLWNIIVLIALMVLVILVRTAAVNHSEALKDLFRFFSEAFNDMLAVFTA